MKEEAKKADSNRNDIYAIKSTVTLLTRIESSKKVINTFLNIEFMQFTSYIR